MKLRPKPLAVLLHLIRNRDRVVPKDELLAVVWPNVSVSALAVWSAVRDLRRALADTDTSERIIETVRGRGVRFVARVAIGAEAAPAPQAGPTRTVASSFVDREDAMTVLRAALASALRGDMRASFIAGAAGMGKTRLAAELSREASELGFEVQVGRCFDREDATSFWPWRQVLRGMLSSERSAAESQRAHAALPDLALIGPDLALAERPPEHGDLGRSEMRFRFFDAVGVFLQRVSAVHPLLIIIDDLHWADEASLLLLESVMATLHGARVHVIGTFREPPLPHRTLLRVLASSARQGSSERIDLSGLRREAVSVLLEDAARQVPAPEVVEAVLAATAGNPLFVSELAKLAVDGQFDVADPRSGLPVPQRVRDVLRWQFERMSPDCQRVLQLLSVDGNEIELAALAQAASAAPHALLDWLSEADAAGLVTTDPQTTRFSFAHDLVRESIYRDLSIAARSHLHRVIAEALEASALKGPGADLGQIAYHYALGAADGAAERAMHFGRLAGEQ
ncbi:MAG TPA: AAA family ATPase, partial [Polyangiales bacterium]|nr:AAA family ATPase [Polyangiales bacterium]